MLTKHKLALLIAAPLVAGATTYAIAEGDEPAGKATIQQLDKHRDGTLDDTERAQRKAAIDARRAARHQEALATYDANKDGTLDDAERRAMRDAKLAERFAVMDKNGDGKLSLEEFKTGARAKAGFHRHGRHGHGRPHRAGRMP